MNTGAGSSTINVLAAVKAGVNVAFLSGNTCCFVAPLTPSSSGVANRILTRAGRYGGIRPAEKAYMADLPVEAPNEATLIGAQTVSPFNGSGDWIVIQPDHWLFAGTGMKKGDRIPGLVGWEFHGQPCEHPRTGDRGRGNDEQWLGQAGPLHGDDLPWPQGQLRLQRLDDLLDAGAVSASGPHAAALAPWPAPRSR